LGAFLGASLFFLFKILPLFQENTIFIRLPASPHIPVSSDTVQKRMTKYLFFEICFGEGVIFFRLSGQQKMGGRDIPCL
jgi:hypothetical protein